MAAKPNSPAPFNTEAAARKIGCATRTLENYVRAGRVVPERTPSGRYIFYREHIELADKIYRSNKRG